MSQIDKLLTLATDFETSATEELTKSAKKQDEKKKGKFPFWLKKKKTDANSAKDAPKAVFLANHANVKDNKVHFPITDAGQARNALARSHQFNTAPPWYKGSLSSLQEAVRRAVKKHYPSIEVSSPKKKASIEVSEAMLSKYSDYKSPSHNEEMAIEWAEKMLRDSGMKIVSAGPEAWDVYPPLSKERIKVDGWKALVQMAVRLTAPMEQLHEKEVLAHSEK